MIVMRSMLLAYLVLSVLSGCSEDYSEFDKTHQKLGSTTVLKSEKPTYDELSPKELKDLLSLSEKDYSLIKDLDINEARSRKAYLIQTEKSEDFIISLNRSKSKSNYSSMDEDERENFNSKFEYEYYYKKSGQYNVQ